MTTLLDHPPTARISVDGIRGIRELATGRPGQVFTTGRDAAGRFTESWASVKAIVTPRGHWYRNDDPKDGHNDTVCRGCGTSGHFDYILDNVGGWCPARPSLLDVVGALRPKGLVA